MKLFFATLATFLFCHASQAAQFLRATDQGHEIFLIFGEQESWMLQKFVVPAGGLQELEWQRTFETQRQASKFLQDLEGSNEIVTFEESMRQDLNFASTEIQNRSLWKVTNAWSVEWEERFHTWVDEVFDTEFFARYELATDCADAAILLRWIFAREHGLPMGNTLAGTGILFTQDSVKRRWLNLPTAPEWHEDERFRAVLNYLADTTYTHTLYVDSYPISVATETFQPGNFLLSLFEDTGHTEIIGEVDFSPNSAKPMVLFASTVPREVRPLAEYVFLSKERESLESGGFRQIRWLEQVAGRASWRLRSGESHPQYSLEQYSDQFDPEGEGFALKLYKYLIPGFDPSGALFSSVEDLRNMIRGRVAVVTEGYEQCQTVDCRPGTIHWENWSTPSRDKRIREKFEQIESLIESLHELLDPTLWTEALKESVVSIEESTLTLSEVREIWVRRIYSYDPRDPIAMRWALTKAAVGSYSERKVRSLFEQRRPLVREAFQRCATEQGCPGDSNFFKKLNTFELDQEIKEVFSGYRTYCLWRSPPCDNESTNPFFAEWANKIPFLVSDPNVAESFRWGEQGSSFLSRSSALIFSQSGSVKIMKDWLVQDGVRYVSLKTGREITLPSQAQCHSAEGSDKLFCLTDSAVEPRLLALLAHNQDSARVAVGPSSQIGLVSDEAVALSSPNKLTVYIPVDGNLVQSAAFAGRLIDQSYENSSRTHRIFASETQKSWVSLSGTQLSFNPLEIEGLESSTVYPFGQDWVVIQKWSQSTRPLFYSPKEGRWVDHGMEGFRFESFDSRSGLSLYWKDGDSRYFLYSGVPDHLQALKVFPAYVKMTSSESGTYFRQYSEEPDYFRFHRGRIEKFATRRGEKVLWGLNGWVFLKNETEGSLVLSRFDRNAQRAATRGSTWFNCENLSGFCSEPVKKERHFAHTFLRQDEQELWTTLYQLDSTGSLAPLSSLPMKIIEGQDYGARSIEEGLLFKWADGEYIYIK